jgi:hypothetical protein
LEIGFFYGFSTVWILDALSAQRDNLHVAIDPFEKGGGGVGLYQIGRLPYVTKFEWIERAGPGNLDRGIGGVSA